MSEQIPIPPQSPGARPELDIASIKARWAKATPGTWEKRPGDIQDIDRGLPRPLVRADGQPIHAVAINRGGPGRWDWITTACETNVDFIAHAHQDIPALIAEVERLLAASARLSAPPAAQLAPFDALVLRWREKARRYRTRLLPMPEEALGIDHCAATLEATLTQLRRAALPAQADHE